MKVQMQNIDEELCLDGLALEALSDIDTIIAEMDKADLCIKKISITNFNRSFIFELAPIFSHAQLYESLECLSICSCVIRLKDAELISSFIKGTINRLKLEIVRSNIRDNALSIIIDAAKQSQVRTLIFRHIWIQESDTKAIISFLELSTLVKLSFSRCAFQTGVLCLIMGAIEKSTLATLILNYVHFNDGELNALVNCIANSKLTKLSLVSASGLAFNKCAIVEAIKKSSLQTLNVRAAQMFTSANVLNDIILFSNVTKFKFGQPLLTFDEKTTLIVSIQRSHHIEYLCFKSIYFNNQSLTVICNLLERSHITNLELSYCELCEAELSELIAAIKKSSITYLDASAFCSKGKNIPIICDLLENCRIEKLKLAFTDCTNEMMATMLPSIMRSSLIKFDIDRCSNVDVSTRNTIKRALRARKQNLISGYKMKSARLH